MSRFFMIPNLRSQAVREMPAPPWQTPFPNGGPPKGATKALFRDWCARDKTNHVFYSVVEGSVPGQRVGVSNPPARVHGFVADYDSDSLVPMDDAAVLASVDKSLKKGGIRPGWMSRTFSNKVRLVWEFAEPLPGDHKDLLAGALEGFLKLAGVKRLLPGYDPSSASVVQFFELGHGWTSAAGAPVPGDALMMLLFGAAKSVRPEGDTELTIPMEELAAEANRQYPGRAPAEADFRTGARCPLFWIPDGIDRIGAVIGDHGVICFSDRAGKAFVPWSEVLGRDFTRGFEERRIGGLVGATWFDNKNYWFKEGELWLSKQKEDMLLIIREAGFSGTASKGQTLSDAEKALRAIQKSRLVEGAAPFLHNPRETVMYNGKKYLNISTRGVMRGAGGDGDPSKWPFTHNLLRTLFRADEDDGHALWHFLAWFRRFWRSCRDGNPLAGHIVVLAGGTNTGKSLLCEFLIPEIMGGKADASGYLLGSAGFNKQLVEVPVWNVDDATSAANQSDHRRFSERIKRHTASPDIDYHPKFKDSIMLPWRGRILLTCNTDSNSMDILPDLDGSILDKIMLFRVTDTRTVFPVSHVLEPMLLEEAPHMLDWLDTVDIPEWTLNPKDARYGVAPYHHPDLIQEAQDRSAAHRLTEIIDAWAAEMAVVHPEMEAWEGNATELYLSIKGTESVAPALQSNNPVALGKQLRVVMGTYKRVLGKRMLDGKNLYKIAIKDC